MPENPTMPLRERFVEVARNFVGLKEADGLNHAPWLDPIFKECGLVNPPPPHMGYAYCACGLRYCLDVACRELGLPIPFTISPSVPTLYASAKSTGRLFTNPDDALMGDLIIWRTYLPSGNWHSRHVEVLTGYRKNGLLESIGFNTSPGDGSIAEGGGVFVRYRPWRNFANVCHPRAGTT